jgi:phage shock protein A
MLDKAENPEKLIRLMIQEMEDTLVEIKASTAAAMASRKKIERVLSDVKSKAERWEERARLAIEKGRDDLAKEAIIEKRRYLEKVRGLEEEDAEIELTINQFQEDILKLEEKLAQVREKQRAIIQRHARAVVRKKTETRIRKAVTSDAFVRFEQFENRIDNLEAEADLINYGVKSTLDEKFENLENEDLIEQELKRMKESALKKSSSKEDDNDND